MTKISYHASHEQFSPGELLRLVQRAERAGFAGAMSSDHFQPWSEQQATTWTCPNASARARRCSGAPTAHGGFTTARRPVRRVIDDPIYGYRRVNVAAQRRDPGSLLAWMARTLRVRKECVEVSWGDWKILPVEPRGVLAMRYDWQEHTFIAVHNFDSKPAVAMLGSKDAAGKLVSLLSSRDSVPDGNGRHVIELEPYAYRWYKLGGTDKLVARSRSAGTA